VEWFKEEGGLKRSLGERLRTTVLSCGDSRDAMEAYQECTGREPSIEPLLERRGLLEPDGE
jgi:peptidyl-dipeptidase Dcp